MTPDYYALLQLPPQATAEEIHKAYRSLARRYHPDRNGEPGAASAMAAINEAYSVLGDPPRRLKYDQMRARSRTRNIAEPVLKAARESVLKHRWPVLDDGPGRLVLEQGSRRVTVLFVDYLDNVMVRAIARRAAGFTVVLAVEIERPVNLSFQIGMIDLVRSEYHGAVFPDEIYRGLFAAFL
jgi:curved DNA-binding protein CbpA